MVVFGDSLSDSGNTTQNITNFAGGEAGPLPQTQKAYAPFYDNGRFTNGPTTSPSSGIKGVWVEQLAPKLGLPVPTFALSGGTNFAFGGATTGSGTAFSGLVANMGTQLGAFCGTCTTVSSHNLYVFLGGADDILGALSNSLDPIAAAHAAAMNIANYIGTLASGGATDFLWANLPALGSIPQTMGLPPAVSAAGNAASVAFNADWAADIGLLESSHPGIRIAGLDTFGLFTHIAANPASFGLADITDPAANFLNGGLNVNPDTFLFWDLQHPTSRGHQILADAAFAAAVPEPATVALAGLGIGVLLIASRRRARRP